MRSVAACLQRYRRLMRDTLDATKGPDRQHEADVDRLAPGDPRKGAMQAVPVVARPHRHGEGQAVADPLRQGPDIDAVRHGEAQIGDESDGISSDRRRGGQLVILG
jgi:hypothetical protein